MCQNHLKLYLFQRKRKEKQDQQNPSIGIQPFSSGHVPSMPAFVLQGQS